MPRLNSMRLIHLPKISALLLLALITPALSGCFLNDDDDDPAPVVDANPNGYYTNSGDVQGGSVAVGDLQALVYDQRIMMMSTANGLLYDGTITNISGNSFSADFTIYTDGKDPVTTTANGTITSSSSITGQLNGSGVGSGIFTLTYAQAIEQQVADLERIKDRPWDGDAAVGPNYQFNINTQGELTNMTAAGFNVQVFDGCEINGTVTPLSGSSLYEVTAILTNCVDSNVDSSATNNYTGFAVSRNDSVVDDTLVLVLSNGTYSPNGELIVN